MSILAKLAERDSEWQKMAKSITRDYPEDAVQEMYLKMHDLEQKGAFNIEDYTSGQVAMYIYSTLRSIIFKKFNKAQKYHHIYEEDMIREIKDTAKTYDLELDALKEAAFESLQDLCAYDRGIVYLTIEIGISGRKLSQESGIPLSSIYHSINKIKENVRKNIIQRYTAKTGRIESEDYNLQS
jgi:DNA-directed RNA polymerase specialized sigma24 family protein